MLKMKLTAMALMISCLPSIGLGNEESLMAEITEGVENFFPSQTIPDRSPAAAEACYKQEQVARSEYSQYKGCRSLARVEDRRSCFQQQKTRVKPILAQFQRKCPKQFRSFASVN